MVAMKGWFTKKPVAHRSLQLDWVIPNKLAVGRFPQSHDLDTLLRHNIQVVVTLAYPDECRLPPGLDEQFRHGFVSMPDSHYPEPIPPTQLVRATKVIHRSLTNHMPVYVHCRAGVERSPLVCIAYLCFYRKVPLGEALRWVKQVHLAAMPTTKQIQVVEYCLKQPELMEIFSALTTQNPA
ncbi:MAG: dual specificity protein phosphatase family protein [Cyanophyceae cyanobacterium]